MVGALVAGGCASTAPATRARPGRVLGANDRIRLGLIGAGGMGNANLSACAKYDDVEVTAVCDVWKAHLDRTRRMVERDKNHPSVVI